ncbi:MAG TPA: DUF1841 family protein [Actinomycetota bacterium]|nr:DUF1841 family protein [Actinomycetota bacterium]
MARRRRPHNLGGAPRRKKRVPRPPVQKAPGLPDTPEARLEEQARKDVMRVLDSAARDLGLSESERLLYRIVEQHPEHLPTFAQAETWKVTGDEDSPFLHFALHKIVEQRVVSREAKLSSTKSWHDAVHDELDTVALELFGEAEHDTASTGS